jgi:polysaccharide biosynthesis transport protein
MNTATARAPTFSVLDVIFGLGRRKLLILTSLILGALLGFAIVSVFKPTYVAEARVLIDDLQTPYDSANVNNQVQRGESRIDERMITSQVTVLQSEDLFRRVIESQQLTQLEDFDPMRKGLGLLSQIKIALGFKNDPRKMTIEDRALEKMSDAVTVFGFEQSNVIGIKYEASNGKLAADVANALAQVYVLSTRETSSGSNDRAREWLSGQIEQLRGKVAASDAAVEKYRAEKGLFKSRDGTLGNQEIAELNSQITLAEAARTEAEAKAQEIRDTLATQGSVDASADVLGSATIQRLRELQVSASRRLSELSATYLPNHPKMIAAQRDVDNVEKQIRREALKIVESLQGQAKIAGKRAASLRNSLEGLKDRETISLQDEVSLKELEREAKANRDQLEVMLARFADSNTRQNLELQPGYARIIQNAFPPANPEFPKLGPTLMLTTMCGLLMGLGLAFLLEIMAQAARANDAAFEAQFGAQPQQRYRHAARSLADDDRIIPDFGTTEVQHSPVARPQQTAPKPAREARPVQAATHAAKLAPAVVVSLASLPAARSATEARDLLAAFSGTGQTVESYGQLVGQLNGFVANGGVKACGLASIGAGFEAASVAVAVARDLSRSGLKTILIDLDSDRGLIPDLMALPNPGGIAELVAGQLDFAKMIQRDTGTPLQVIRYGAVTANSAAQISANMASITKTLSSIYDLVLVHTGEASPATLGLVKGCDAMLLLAPTQRQRDAAAAASTLGGVGIENVYLVRVEGPLQKAA